MKIAVVGAGNIGSGLGKIWAEKGNEVVFTFSRDMSRLEGLAKSIPNSKALPPKEAVEGSDVVLLSVVWGNVEEAIKACGPLEGKVVIDCTNPLKPDLSGLAVGHTTSAAEEIQKLAPGALVVKAFNTVFAQVYHTESRLYGTRRLTMPYCGDDGGAKAKVSKLINQVGFDPLDAGGLSIARYIEPMAMLVIHLGYGMKMGTNIAWSLLRR